MSCEHVCRSKFLLPSPWLLAYILHYLHFSSIWSNSAERQGWTAVVFEPQILFYWNLLLLAVSLCPSCHPCPQPSCRSVLKDEIFHLPHSFVKKRDLFTVICFWCERNIVRFCGWYFQHYYPDSNGYRLLLLSVNATSLCDVLFPFIC